MPGRHGGRHDRHLAVRPPGPGPPAAGPGRPVRRPPAAAAAPRRAAARGPAPRRRPPARNTARPVADVYQFHALLAAAVTGDPGRGLLPGPRPDPRVLDAYRDQRPDPDAATATARFQFFRPSALRPDGPVPRGFVGSDHWLW